MDELDISRQIINNLRKFVSDRNEDFIPLLEENTKLNKELASYNCINIIL